MAPEDAAFASFERKWLEGNPEQAIVAVFLAPDERRRASAFGSLVHELEQTAFGVREPQVAAAKLDWWRRELSAGTGGTSRHPIARELFDDERARGLDDWLWSNLIDGALVQVDAGAASTLDESIALLGAFYRPVAALEAALVGGDAAQADANAHLWTSSHMLHSAAAQPGHEHTLPLDLLARHGLARSGLAGPSPQRTALLREFLGSVHTQISGALALAPRASLGRRVRARLDLELAARSRRSADPAVILASPPGARRWRSLWLAWREAKASTSGDPKPSKNARDRT
jgi:phytoene synthase